jgi:iron only hydrogenase large subunit-like protein/DNA-binding CsgD family transcriptional regulator/transcriptional regulator with XRE-family HTH domain
MACPEALKHVRTIDLRSSAQIRAGTCVAAVITSDDSVMWQDDYVKTGLPAGLEVRCRVLDNDSYCNTGDDWLVNTTGEDEDEFVFNFYGFEGEDWLDNIKRRALAVLDKHKQGATADDCENDIDTAYEDRDSFDEEADAPEFSSGPTRCCRADFSEVDWSLTNAEIARQLGITSSAVYYQRKQRRPDTVVHKRKVDYINIDWSLSNMELSEQFGVTPDYISSQRKLRSTYTGIEKPRNIDYSKVDWSQTDRFIAKQLGVGQRTISRQRKKRRDKKEKTQDADKFEEVDGEESSVEKEKGSVLYSVPPGAGSREKRQESNVTKIPAGKIDYSNADWAQPDKILARQLGVTQDTVARQRRRRGVGAPKDRYADVDWAQTNADIARRLGVAPATVWYQRVKRKIKSAGRCGKVDYALADWSLPNKIIAQQLGVAHDTIARQRRKRGMGAAPDKYAAVDWLQANKEIARQVGVTSSAILYQRKKRNIMPAADLRKIDYSDVDWSQTDKRIAQLLGVTPSTISRRRRQKGILPVKDREDKYADVDWSQNNREIARQFGVTPRAIAYQRKRRMQSGTPGFIRRRTLPRRAGAELMNTHFPVYTLKNECNDCYRCIRECYVKAIQIKDGHASVVSGKCLSCGQCVRACPSNAKRIRYDVDRVKTLLGGRKKVFVSLAPSWAGVFDRSSAGMTAVLKKAGFAGVSETALGAQEVSIATAAILAESDNTLFISSACPVIVDHVRLYAPRFVDHIVPLASPALTHAKMLKERFGQDIGVVFIGPCVAKKTEAQRHPELIDVALTFEELHYWLKQESINIYAKPLAVARDDTFLPPRSYEGALYPLEGGMNETLKRVGIEETIKLLTISSLEVFDSALQSFNPKNTSGKIFVEALACKGGCINGPGIFSKKASIDIASDILQKVHKRAKIPHKVQAVVEETYSAVPVPSAEYTQDVILRVMQRIGKYSAEDELNCGGCGYASCRSLAKAVLSGEAETSMCVSHMRKIAMKKADAMLRCMPSASVIVDSELTVLEANDAFMRMFCGDNYEFFASRSDGLKGTALDRILSFPDVIMAALKTGRDVHKEHYPVNDRLYDISAFTVEANNLVGAIITDVTESMMNKEKIAQKAREVISKNVSIVQNIAYLLGEHMVETETLLSSMAQDYRSMNRKNRDVH